MNALFFLHVKKTVGNRYQNSNNRVAKYWDHLTENHSLGDLIQYFIDHTSFFPLLLLNEPLQMCEFIENLYLFNVNRSGTEISYVSRSSHVCKWGRSGPFISAEIPLLQNINMQNYACHYNVQHTFSV